MPAPSLTGGSGLAFIRGRRRRRSPAGTPPADWLHPSRSSRVSMLRTCAVSQNLWPRAVGIPRWVSAAAMAYGVVMPLACISAIIGASATARASARTAHAMRAASRACGVAISSPWRVSMFATIAGPRHGSKTSAADCLRYAKLRKFAGYLSPSIDALVVPGSFQFVYSALYDAHRSFAVPSAARPSIDESSFFLGDIHARPRMQAFPKTWLDF
jgi:hypothetical protein